MTVQIYTIIPLVLGCIAVLQTALNRRIFPVFGLGYTVLLNGAVLTLVAGAFALTVRTWPDSFPEEFLGRFVAADLRWWFLIPGSCGFLIVSSLPWTLSRVGALQLFVGIVAGQIVASALWDATFEGHPLTPTRIAGGLLAIAAVVLASSRS